MSPEHTMAQDCLWGPPKRAAQRAPSLCRQWPPLNLQGQRTSAGGRHSGTSPRMQTNRSATVFFRRFRSSAPGRSSKFLLSKTRRTSRRAIGWFSLCLPARSRRPSDLHAGKAAGAADLAATAGTAAAGAPPWLLQHESARPVRRLADAGVTVLAT